MKQTAVDWLRQELEYLVEFEEFYTKTYHEFDELFNKAKDIEKEQIINAWDKRGDRIVPKYFLQENITGEQYYNETFKLKKQSCQDKMRDKITKAKSRIR